MSAGLVQGAFAQGNGGATAQKPAEIVVTGSRIVRRDYTSNSPIVTLNAESFQNTANVAIESALDKLPQFNPAKNQFSEALDVQNTPTNSIGAATISLRGLGANRNLVLINGRRAQPVDASMAVDINGIPSAAIERVETITGGASAVYGADAIAGVTNFILKKNFQGFTMDSQYGITQQGDDREFKISALMGTNFADDRGNVMLGLEHYTRSASLYKDHSFYTKGQTDPTVGPNGTTIEFFMPGTGYTVDPLNKPSAAALTSVYGAPGWAATNFIGQGNTFIFNQTAGTNVSNVSLWTNQGPIGYLPGPNGTGFDASTRPGKTLIPYRNFSFYTFGYDHALKQTFNNGQLSLPMKRYSAYASGHYDINDWVTAFMSARFASSKVHTVLFSAPAVTGWAVNIPYDCTYDSPIGCTSTDPSVGTNPSFENYGNTTVNPLNTSGYMQGVQMGHHPVSAQVAALLNSRTVTVYCDPSAVGCGAPGTLPTFEPSLVGTNVPNTGPNAPWQLSLVPSSDNSWLPPRQSDDSTQVYEVTLGFRGNLPFKDWTYSVYAEHGRSESLAAVSGQLSLQRLRAVVTAPNYGLGWSSVNDPRVGNNGDPNWGFGIGTDSCTSGLPILTRQSVSANCVKAISATVQASTALEQNIVEADIQGGLFNLPAGQVRFALGADYREDMLHYIPDTLQSQGSFIDQVAGVYPTQETSGSTDTREVYTEFSIPIVKDLPFLKKVELDPGYRFSQNNPSGGVHTYKILADIQFTDWLRLRGGYQQASRAPNIGELDLAPTQLFGVGAPTLGDPCSPGGISSPYNLFGYTSPNTQTPWAAGNVGVTNEPWLTHGVDVYTNTTNICKALMGGYGPNATPGAGVYYSSPGTYANNGAGVIFGWGTEVGNPNLKAEKAGTWTAGVVVSSPWQNPLLSRLQLSVDYYAIRITNAIGTQSADAVYQACLSQDGWDAAQAQIAAASPACQLIQRNHGTGGTNVPVTVMFSNNGRYSIEGYDAQINWGADLADIYGLKNVPGSVGVNVLFSYLDRFNTLASVSLGKQRTVQWRGTLGPTLTGLNGGAYDYRLNTTFTYAVGPFTMGLVWHYLPTVNQAQYATAANNRSAALAAGNAGSAALYAGQLKTFKKVGAYNEFDMYANYKVGDHLTLRAGINNLFDIAPRITAHTLDYPALFQVGSSGQGSTAGFYDVLGRRFFVGGKITF